MQHISKVVVIGLDGLEPSIVDAMLARGELPNLARVREQGGYSRVATTLPAQTPVAWSTFATGTNPGGHGIFDFIRRDPATYLPDLALNRYEQKSTFLPPKAVNLRRGTALWELLSDAGIPSVVLRCPCTYPPDNIRGRMLSGMGVPDLRGGLGTGVFYTSAVDVAPQESEMVVHVQAQGREVVQTQLIGPRNPKTGGDAVAEIRLELDRTARRAVLRSEGEPAALELREGEWSDWLRIKFKLGLLQSAVGMQRFFLRRLEPVFELYASPVNFAPDTPLFPISSPWEYAGQLAKRIGPFHTTGMVEDHTGLNNGRFDEAAYLAQCEQVLREREAMMLYELERFEEGLFFCLFDTPDRIQHMFWRFGEPDHPANREPAAEELRGEIAACYRRCDEIVGKALAFADDRTLFITLSDHGFNSFQRGVHLNSWLLENGFLALRPGIERGEEAGDLLQAVDWSRTQAYALGLGSIYLNLAGREAEGTVAAAEAREVGAALAARLSGLVDPERGQIAVRGVVAREQAYSGLCAAESPDLVVNFAPGYRVSWPTALGGVPHGLFEDNVKRWSGDHIIDPHLVPGALFMNRPFEGKQARLMDLAPTILAALGVPAGPAMEGTSLFNGTSTS